MKISKYISFLILSCLLYSSNVFGGSKNNWYDKSRYGLFVHYVPGLSIYPTGGSTSDINVVANNFDAKQLATDAQAFGVEYVVFTVMHYRMRVYQQNIQAILPVLQNRNDVRIFPTIANNEICFESQNELNIKQINICCIDGRLIKTI